MAAGSDHGRRFILCADVGRPSRFTQGELSSLVTDPPTPLFSFLIFFIPSAAVFLLACFCGWFFFSFSGLFWLPLFFNFFQHYSSIVSQ